MMQIYDSTCNKVRKVKDLMVKHYTLPSIEDNKAIEKSVAGVQFTVVGSSSEWVNWISNEDFTQFNPDVDISALS